MLLLDDLRQILHDRPGEVVFVVGAGVAVGALHGSPRQDVATWVGLLRDGLRRAHDLDRLTTGEFVAYSQLLNVSVPGAAVDVASAVERLLGAPHGGEYRRWLRETVGAFDSHMHDRGVLDALAQHQRRGALLATTNYDLLLEHVTQLPPVTWRDPAGVERALRGDEPQILHLHGVWRLPESVVLGSKSYEDVVRDSHAQATLATLRTARTFVFVGCGAGLHDPNIGAFLRWTATVFAGSEYRHFRLCLRSEINELRREHPEAQRIYPLAYGESHGDLAPFLLALLSNDEHGALSSATTGDRSQGSSRAATVSVAEVPSHSPSVAAPSSGLAPVYRWLLGATGAALVAGVVWAIASAVSPPPPRIEACEIECSGCQGVRRAWLRLESGDTYVVRTRGNIIEFFCPFERTTVAVILEIEDENLRISYRSARIEIDPAKETILVSAEDFADEPISARDLAEAKRMQSRWCGRGSATTAASCQRIECPDGQVRRDNRCVELVCADGYPREDTRCVPLCTVEEIAKNGRCQPRCNENERFEAGECVLLPDDSVSPASIQPEFGTSNDDPPQTVAALRQPQTPMREQPASADALIDCVIGSDECEAFRIKPKIEPKPQPGESIADCLIDATLCRTNSEGKWERIPGKALDTKTAKDVSVDCILDPSTCGSPSLKRKNEPAPPPTTLGLEDIRAGVGPAKEAARANCSGGSLGGEKIKVKLSISGPSGKVVSSSVIDDAGKYPLGQCVAAELKHATFKKVEKEQIGTEVTVQF